MRPLSLIFVFLLLSVCLNAGAPSIIFKENKGQWPEKVLFGAGMYNTQFYVNKNSFNYCVYSMADLKKGAKLHHNRTNTILRGHNYEVEFVGGNLNDFTKTNEQPEYYNYFLGKKNKWTNHVNAFSQLQFNSVYENIDLKLYSKEANLKYDFIIKPKGNPNSIQLHYKYIDGITINKNDLVVRTSVGEIIEQKPFAYQIINGKEITVKCQYVLLQNNLVGFSFPEGYNNNFELVIDPTVIVCSYSGHTLYGAGSAATYDSKGNIYNTGYCRENYPTTPGAFCSTYYGFYDITLSVYNPTGTAKIFSTYIGGDSLDLVTNVNVTKKEIVLTGITLSDDFPCTATAFDTTLNGLADIIVSKLSLDGDSLYASTFIGGNYYDGGYYGLSAPTVANGLDGRMESVLDTAGNVYLITITNSTNFPLTSSAISATLQGGMDACVFKLDNSLSNLVWSTYLGGNGSESGKGIRLDGTGGVYCFGTTTSNNFPVTSGVISTIKLGFVGGADMFMTHINSTGGLIASTYFGTIASDYAGFMDLDLNGDIYVCGHIESSVSFTPTPGIYNNPNGYNTIYKINPSLSSIIYKTRFGFPPPPVFPAKSPYLIYTAFRVDSCQNLYLAGSADNMLPTTSNQIQPFAGGITDIYIAVFGQNCSSLKFASFFGGPVTHFGYGEHCDGGVNHFDSRGVLYQNICSDGGLPTTPGAYAPTFVSSGDSIYNDAFVKIDLQTFVNAGSSYGSAITGCPPFTPTFVSTTNLGTTYWNLGNGVTSTLDTVSTTYTNLGNYNVLLVVTDTSTCNKYDSIKSILSVINPTVFDLGEDIPTCITTKAFVQSNVIAVTYSWSTGQTTPNILALPGTYTLTINNGGCNSSDEINVVVAEKKLSERFPNVITPNGDLVNDLIDFTKYNFDEVEFIVFDRWGRERYKITNPQEQWQPNDLNNGTYFYVVSYKSSCIGKFATDKGVITVFK